MECVWALEPGEPVSRPCLSTEVTVSKLEIEKHSGSPLCYHVSHSALVI